GLLRVSRGDRLVRARPQGRILPVLPAVLARLSPLLEEHRRRAPGPYTARTPAAPCPGGTPRPIGKASLPNPIPLQWNPVRTYLGARNSVRFIRRHAGPLRTLKFVGSTAYNIPLEVLAIVLDREEELQLGLLTYRSALARYCLEAVGWSGDRRPTAGETLRALGRSPVSLLRDLPRDIRQARAEGLTVQVDA